MYVNNFTFKLLSGISIIPFRNQFLSFSKTKRSEIARLNILIDENLKIPLPNANKYRLANAWSWFSDKEAGEIKRATASPDIQNTYPISKRRKLLKCSFELTLNSFRKLKKKTPEGAVRKGSHCSIVMVVYCPRSAFLLSIKKRGRQMNTWKWKN